MTDNLEFKMHYVGKDMQHNPQPPDDSMPGDRGAADKDPAGTVTREREYKGYKLERRNPWGFWHVVELPELNTFTDEKAAQLAIDLHLEKQKEVA